MTSLVLALAVLLQQDVPASGHGAGAAAGPVRVQVTYLHPSGAILPAGGAGVRVERRRMPRPGEEGEPEVVQAWRATASAGGAALFDGLPPLGTAEADRVLVEWRGATTEEQMQAPNDGRVEPLQVVVREPLRDLTMLRMSVRVTLSPNDSGLQVEHLFELENASHYVIDTDQGAGLVLPLTAPAPWGAPVESFLPPRPEPRVFLAQSLAGRVLVEGGRLVYRGPVQPEGTRVRVVYVLPYAGETSHTYGFVMPLDASAVALMVNSPERISPEVALRGRSEGFVRSSLGGEGRTALLIDKPKAGEVVLFDVRGTPDRHVFYRPLAAGLGALVVAILIAFAASRRRA